METNNETLYAERQQLIKDALEHKEGKRVPICVQPNTFAATYGGFTQAEVNYDIDKLKVALLKYAHDFKPDRVRIVAGGMGPVQELIQDKTQLWAGNPINKIDENSMTQFLEFSLLEEDEFDSANTDLTGWLLRDCYPKIAGINEPLKKLKINMSMATNMSVTASLAQFFTDPEVIEMIEKYQKVSVLLKENATKKAAIEKKLKEEGFPSMLQASMVVPWDHYTDYYRGTEEGMMDIYLNPEQIQWHFNNYMPIILDNIKKLGQKLPTGSFVFMPLHKGDISFISDKDYQKLYWPYLYNMVVAILDQGLTPYLFCEGNYENRLKYLKEFPKGVYCRFERMDMALAKKEIGDQVCIGGAFPNSLLERGTKEQIADECKRLIDICAPGGGFIFEPAYNLTSDSKIENVEVMFDVLHTYGKC